MKRDEACNHVAKLITDDRNKTHGDPVDQLSHAQRIKETVGHRQSEKLSQAEKEAIDMICTKLSRLAKGTPIEDHYLDIIGYAAIAIEALGQSISEAELHRLGMQAIKDIENNPRWHKK